MPRGYLKHNRGAGRKKALGGSSGRGYNEKEFWQERGEKSSLILQRSMNEDFSLSTHNTTSECNDRKAPTNQIGECSICFKQTPLACMSTKCKWHAAACSQCLRRVYVSDAKKSSKNYPLRCFHPLCDQPVHASQLEKHSLFSSPSEVKTHHDMLIHARIEKAGGVFRTVLCPRCDTPRGLQLFDKDRVYGCANCKKKYWVSPDYVTIRTMENMKEDEFGTNDGWAKCPKCSILISKGDGCDHMWCVYCDHEFSWEEAQRRTNAIPFARPPDREIYLWW
ncbi:hypothetical protein ACHAXT_012976 [Thalassiosira profunda]